MKRFILALLFFPFLLSAQQNSILSTGSWYKISTQESGVYKITQEDLISYGIDITSVNPKNISIYGNPSGMLPEDPEESHYTDLSEIAIKVIGEEDEVFDSEDYILFYGQSPDTWYYIADDSNFVFNKNLYSDVTCYFLTISNSEGKRIKTIESTTLEPTETPEFYNAMYRIEEDLVNPGKSGKDWLGRSFDNNDTLIYSFYTSDLLYNNRELEIRLAASSSEISNFSIFIDQELYQTVDISAKSNSDYYKTVIFTSEFTSVNQETEIMIVYNNPIELAQAWVDYIDIKYNNSTNFYNNQLSFCSKESIGSDKVTQFNLYNSGGDNLTIWNISDPLNIGEINASFSDNNYTFTLETPELLTFHAFNELDFYSPEFLFEVENQNLHGDINIDYLIVTHSDFLTQAEELGSYHGNNDDLNVKIVNVFDIYNEFSTGSQDITAIRNYVKYLYDNSDNKIKYLLLFGDASYDYKNRIDNNTNFVPVFESANSFNNIISFASDAYFGILQDNNDETIKLPVGRIPVSTAEEAQNAVNKISSYNTVNNYGKWKNNVLMIGDNGDSNIHTRSEDRLSDTLSLYNPDFNITKCYLDFFEIIETEEGLRCPMAKAEIDEKIEEGVFYMNFTGHGGAEFLTEEQVVTLTSAANWTNSGKLPVMTIASGGSALFDDPHETSLGKELFNSEIGGAIAVISTTKPTYSSANYNFNTAVINNLTNGNGIIRMGDLIKNTGTIDNDLKWALLGDPALKLSFPENIVETTFINGLSVNETIDTIYSGDTLKIKGNISDYSGNVVTDFTGAIYLKVFAPPYLRETLGQESSSTEYLVQDSILVEGISDVVDGIFNIDVVIPDVYLEEFGMIKLSYYAFSNETDASGFFNEITYGGNPNSISENNDLLDFIKVYPTVFDNTLNIETFISGNFNYSIYNTQGKLVVPSGNITSSHEIISLANLSSGMYLIRISSDNSSANFKVFKK